MRSLDFLSKLKIEGKLEVVESSEEISLSYEKKAIECRDRLRRIQIEIEKKN